MPQANPNIEAVYASNVMMAAGASRSRALSKKNGDIKILGTDGLPGPAGGIRAVAYSPDSIASLNLSPHYAAHAGGCGLTI